MVSFGYKKGGATEKYNGSVVLGKRKIGKTEKSIDFGCFLLSKIKELIRICLNEIPC